MSKNLLIFDEISSRLCRLIVVNMSRSTRSKFDKAWKMRWTSQCLETHLLSRRNFFETIDALTQWRRLNANDENKQRHIQRTFDEIIYTFRTRKRKSLIKKKWNFVESFELSATLRRDFDVSFVERSLKIIDSKKYQKYLIWFAEIKMILFLNELIILTSKQDF
jgi:hypothetical protein